MQTQCFRAVCPENCICVACLTIIAQCLKQTAIASRFLLQDIQHREATACLERSKYIKQRRGTYQTWPTGRQWSHLEHTPGRYSMSLPSSQCPVQQCKPQHELHVSSCHFPSTQFYQAPCKGGRYTSNNKSEWLHISCASLYAILARQQKAIPA